MKKLFFIFVAIITIGTIGSGLLDDRNDNGDSNTKKEIPTYDLVENETESVTEETTAEVTEMSTEAPTEAPTVKPTQAPTVKPTQAPTVKPTVKSTQAPTQAVAQATPVQKETTPKVTVPQGNETGANLVWVPTSGGTKYHRYSGCSNMKSPKQVTLQTAIANGYTACKKCY